MFEGIGEFFNNAIEDVIFLVRAFLILGLITGGAIFLYIGYKGLDNSLTIAACAATASALFVGAILLIVYQGFAGIHRRQEAQTELLEQQNAYLRQLTERRREQPSSREVKPQ